jgi:DNA repair protein RadC
MEPKTTTPTKKIKLLTLRKNQTEFPAIRMTSSREASEFIRQFYLDDIGIFESFFILLLNRQNVTTGYAKISQGGVSGTVVDIKIIAKYAVDFLASSVILAHNHPSGNLSPSQADISLTKKTVAALKFLDISVIEHLILTEDSYYSFADEGQI